MKIDINIRSDYEQYIVDDVIVIEDLNLGSKSVTNDMRKVLSDIEDADIILKKYKIIFKNLEGIYNGMKITDYRFKNITFYPIGVKSLDDALQKVKGS